VPVAPTNLTATPGNAQVVLNWTASTGATSYVVKEATTSGGPYTVLNSDVTTATYTASGLGNGTTYYYVVAATGTGGTGSNSAEVGATPNSNVNLIWYGGVSSAWDTATANWQEGGSSLDYAEGDTVVFSDTAATSSVIITGSFNPASVTFNNSVLSYVLTASGAGLIGGGTGLIKSGSANVLLGGSNTFSGPTTIISGTLSIGNTDALLNSSVNYNGGTLGFGTLTSATLGGLEGSQALSLNNGSGAGVALVVGNNGQSTSYAGTFDGAGSLTKIGAGTLILSGTGSNSAAVTTSGGILAIGPGASVYTGTGNITAGQLQIAGGTLVCSLTSNITAGSGGLVVNSGTASFSGGLTSDPNVDSNIFVCATGGTLSMASLYLGRTTLVYLSQPAAGSTTTGLYVNGGAVLISGALNVCNNSRSNSSDSVRMDSGALTVGSTATVTLNNGGRWSVLDINGGTFTSNDYTGAGIQLGGVFAAENGAMLVRSGTAYADTITFGDVNQTSGVDALSMTGGALYLASGGMVLGGAGGYSYSVVLSGTGTLGALANWSSSLNMTLGGDTIQAGDNFGNAQNITLTGTLSGTTLLKTGKGTLLIGGSCSLTGSAAVGAGILEISGSFSGATSMTIASGATVYLAGGSLAVSGSITNNGIFKISGTPMLSLTGHFINNGVLDLINGPSSLPPNFVNNGTVLTAGNELVQQANLSGTTFSLTVKSYVEHTYQLQRASSLTVPNWTNIGAAQAGTGSALVFSDSGGATGSQGFYRVMVSP
jgi:autotransporter-associated beta strand protein